MRTHEIETLDDFARFVKEQGLTMAPEDKRLWVEALRSGEFKQQRGTLGRDNYLCCIGVLGRVKKLYTRSPERHLAVPFSTTDTCIALGWLSTAPEGKFKELFVNLNDLLKWDFKKIADAVELIPSK